MTNRRINVSALEFDEIKANLKEFLRGQSQFSDYDFEGSNMAVMLDVLAYNTHYNALYTNLAINEVFLDSASKRDSVVSLAKGLGYTPRSAYSARTKVSFSVINTTTLEPFITLPKLTPFNGQIDGRRFVFYTTKDISVPITGNSYVFEDIELVEGFFISNRIAYTEENRYLIPNPALDMSTLRVRIQESGGSTTFKVFYPANLEADIDGSSEVYFLKEIDSGFFEIYFGDGILGKQIQPGNVVNLDYFVSSGVAANGIRTLQYGGNRINGGTISNISLQAQTSGGRFPETTEEIRFNAPNMYSAQNRAVTAKDYEAIILNKVPAIEDVVVWGGENNVPPVYGKVFISATTKSGLALTFEEKQGIIRDVINKFKVVSIVPEFTEPEILYVVLDCVAYYDPVVSSAPEAEIVSTITQNILSYDNVELKKFSKVFRQSAITRLIESSNESIVSSAVRFKIKRTIDIAFGRPTNYKVVIGNPIERNSLTSTKFVADRASGEFYLYDDGNGKVNMMKQLGGIRSEVGTVGSIDYENGIIDLQSLNITSDLTQQFSLIFRADTADVVAKFNQVIALERGSLKVAVIPDYTTRGRTENRFVFTPNKI
jgi:hypothetical protein